MIRVIGPRDSKKGKYPIYNITSSGCAWKCFSPFILGPCYLHYGYVSKTMENAWQFAKVYRQFADRHNDPTDAYWDWACEGWADTRAHRYPMGKNAIPLYSYWNGAKLDYITARRKIYIPLYTKAVTECGRLDAFVQEIEKYDDVWLWDYDGYDHHALGMKLKDVLACQTRKMGHAFVLLSVLYKCGVH